MDVSLANHEDGSLSEPTIDVQDEVERAIAMLEQTVQACKWKPQGRSTIAASANLTGVSAPAVASSRFAVSDSLGASVRSTGQVMPLSTSPGVVRSSSSSSALPGSSLTAPAEAATPIAASTAHASSQEGDVRHESAPSSAMAFRAACSAAMSAAAAVAAADQNAQAGTDEAADSDEALQAEALALRTELRRADARLHAATSEAAAVNTALREGQEWHQRWLKETQASIAVLRCKNDVLERSMQQACTEERRLTDAVRAEPERTEEKLTRLRQECMRLEKENSRLESEMAEMRAELSSVREVVSKETRRTGSVLQQQSLVEQIASRAPFRVNTSQKAAGRNAGRGQQWA